jgi:hypothetical protein
MLAQEAAIAAVEIANLRPQEPTVSEQSDQDIRPT